MFTLKFIPLRIDDYYDMTTFVGRSQFDVLNQLKEYKPHSSIETEAKYRQGHLVQWIVHIDGVKDAAYITSDMLVKVRDTIIDFEEKLQSKLFKIKDNYE